MLDKNVTSAAPGSAKGFLIVSDIEVARDQLVAAGVKVGEFFHDGPEGRGSGPRPERRTYRSRAAPQATWRAHFGVRRPLTARHEKRIGQQARHSSSEVIDRLIGCTYDELDRLGQIPQCMTRVDSWTASVAELPGVICRRRCQCLRCTR